MRLDQMDVTTIEVEGLRFAIRLSWDEFRKLVRGSGTVTADTADAALDEMHEALRKHVIGVEGLTKLDEDGNEQAVAWQPDMVGQLAPRFVRALFAQLVNPGSGRQAGDPLA